MEVGSNNLGPPAGAPLVRKDAKDATVTLPPVAPIPYGVHHPQEREHRFPGGNGGPKAQSGSRIQRSDVTQECGFPLGS